MYAKWVKPAVLILVLVLLALFRWSNISEIKDSERFSTVIYKRDVWTGRVWAHIHSWTSDEKKFQYNRRIASRTGWPWMPTLTDTSKTDEQYADGEYTTLTWMWAVCFIATGSWLVFQVRKTKGQGGSGPT